jgi:hypothetical protein
MRSTLVATAALSLVACAKHDAPNSAAARPDAQDPAVATGDADADAVGASARVTGLGAATAPALKDTHRQDPALAQGANSFTRDEARKHIEHAGYADVGDLLQDDAGVWHGRALKDGQAVDVALDFKGDVSAVRR